MTHELTVKELKERVNKSISELKSQYPELTKLNGNSRHFWVKALKLTNQVLETTESPSSQDDDDFDFWRDIEGGGGYLEDWEEPVVVFNEDEDDYEEEEEEEEEGEEEEELKELLERRPYVQRVYETFKKINLKDAEKYLENMLAQNKPKQLLKTNCNQIKFKPRSYKVDPEIEVNPKKETKLLTQPKKFKQLEREIFKQFDQLKHPITGEVKTISEWANDIGITLNSFKIRLLKKGNVPDIYAPKYKLIDYKKLMNITKLDYSQVRYRVRKYGANPDKWPTKIYDYTRLNFLYEWSEKYNLSWQNVYYRWINYGEPENWPSKEKTKRANGEIVKIANYYGVSRSSIHLWIKKYGPPEQWSEELKQELKTKKEGKNNERN